MERDTKVQVSNQIFNMEDGDGWRVMVCDVNEKKTKAQRIHSERLNYEQTEPSQSGEPSAAEDGSSNRTDRNTPAGL